MKASTLLLILVISQPLFAQTNTTIDVVAPGSTTGSGSVNISNPSEIGMTKTIEVDERSVSGSAFWRSDWNKAIVFLQKGGAVKLKQAKLNLNSNETYFTEAAGTVKAADMSLINKLIFLDKTDSLKTMAVFQKLTYNGATSFFQVLNGGEYQLLKGTQVLVKKKEYDPMVGKDEFNYDIKSIYYLIHAGDITELGALNKNVLASHLPFSDKDNNWLSTNNNRLKKETDFVEFLNYYNGRK